MRRDMQDGRVVANKHEVTAWLQNAMGIITLYTAFFSMQSYLFPPPGQYFG